MGDQWLNDSLAEYIKDGSFDNVDNSVILWYFQNMKMHGQ